jgi:hypothetical protein
MAGHYVTTDWEDGGIKFIRDGNDTRKFNVLTGETKDKPPEEIAFQNAINQRDIVSYAIKTGELSCMNGDTKPALNIANGTVYKGVNQLVLKEHQKSFGFHDAQYLTYDAMHKAGEDLRESEYNNGVSISFSALNKDTGKWETKNTELYNVEQCWAPDEVTDYYKKQHENEL